MHDPSVLLQGIKVPQHQQMNVAGTIGSRIVGEQTERAPSLDYYTRYRLWLGPGNTVICRELIVEPVFFGQSPHDVATFFGQPPHDDEGAPLPYPQRDLLGCTQRRGEDSGFSPRSPAVRRIDVH
jgi:hypothetical protein